MKSRNNKIKKSKGERLFNLINNIFLLLLSIILIYPIYYVFIASLSDANLLIVNSNNFLWHPLETTLDAYRIVMSYPSIWKSYVNTIFILLVGVPLNMLCTIIGAYFMTRKGIVGQKLFSKMVIFTMFFSGGMIPFYLVVKGIGLLDSIWAVILPTAINTYNMIIMRTAFSGVPDSLIEAAEMEGANDFVILWKILSPVSIATIMVLIMYYAVGHWNSWFNAMIFVSDKTKWPLQLLVRSIIIEESDVTSSAGSEAYKTSETVKYAVIVVTTLPILFVYPFIQRYFMQGVMVGAVKG